MNLFNILKRPGETFAAKIFLAIILLIVVLSLSFTGFFVHYQWKTRTEEMGRQGEEVARLLAYTVRLGVFAENPDLLKDPVDGVLQNRGILRVTVYSLDGRPIREGFRKAAGDEKLKAVLSEKDLQATLSRLKRTRDAVSLSRNADTMESWVPVLSGSRNPEDEELFFADTVFHEKERVIGFVRVVLDRTVLNDSLRKLLVNSSLIALISLALAVVAVYFLVKGVTGPLNRLTERVRSMGGGQRLEKVPVETGDEIGRLASAFNAMAESLQNRETEKAHLEQQLRQAHKMEAIGTLAGGVAHDFNNILSAIEGYAILLQDRIKKKSAVRAYVDQILAAAERASELTRRLLAFSRNQVINPKPINVNDTIANIRELLARLLGENIEFRIITSREELVVLADELQLEQTVINLVTNARDAMTGGGILEIRTELAEVPEQPSDGGNQVGPGTYARIVVLDTGVGIDPSTRERIFDPFFTTKDVGKGTGLGLSMAYGIIKQHNGYLQVESVPGRTEFSIYLPVIQSVVERKKLEHSLLPTGNGEKVLLAEDDRFVRMLTKHILTKYGYQVVEAVDGEDALEKFRDQIDSIQLLLLDVIMPKKNGRQIYDEAVRLKPGVKVIFMSGHTYDVITREGVLSEGTHLLSKPLTPGELLVKLREVLDGRAVTWT